MCIRRLNRFSPRREVLLGQLRYITVPPLHYNIDVCLTFLLYQYRSRESEADDGKDEKDYVVPQHFLLGVLRGLDDFAGRVVNVSVHWQYSCQNEKCGRKLQNKQN